MNKIILEVTVRGQEISCTVPMPYPRANTRRHLHVHFSVDEMWEGLKKIAIFRRSGAATAAIPLDDGMVCEMPPQMLAVPAVSGTVTVHIGLIGIGKDESRLTTGEVPVTINPSCYTEGKTPHPPAPDVYEELLRLIRDAAENDEEEIRAALDGYFVENPIELPIMSENVAGVAKVGDGLCIDAEGRLSVDQPENEETEVNGIILIDREDGKKYVVYVSGGALMMEEYRSSDGDDNGDGEEGGGGGDGGDSVDQTVAIVGKAIVGLAVVGKRGI